jgi:lysylphosphatidylglycerol synthetase-like protein (DUF2156 family)
MDKNTSSPRRVARALTIALWAVGSAYLVKSELANASPDWVVIAATPIIWAAVLTLPALVHHALRDRQIIAASLLFIAAVVGSGYTLSGTVARQSEVRDTRVQAAAQADRDRVRAKHMLEEAEELAAVSLDKLTRECKTGEGIKCKGLLRANQINEDAVRVRKADLARVPEIAAPKAGEQRIAAGLSYVFGGKAANYTEPVELFLPAMLGLTVELAALATAMFGWHNRQPSRKPENTRATEAATVVPVASNDLEPLPPKGGNRRRVATKAAAEADVIQLVARGEPIPSQDTLADRWGVHKGTASKWLRDFESRGILRRQVVGRCKMVAAA